MLWVVLGMGVLTHLSLRQIFKYARRMTLCEKTPARSSLCEGRQRLGVEPVRSVFEQVVRPLATPNTPGAFYKGFRLMAIDGTVQDVPDTPANAEHFGRSSGGRGDSAFPQLRKVSLVEVGTHVEVALTIGGYHDGEQTPLILLLGTSKRICVHTHTTIKSVQTCSRLHKMCSREQVDYLNILVTEQYARKPKQLLGE
jgi:hypothetical protein